MRKLFLAATFLSTAVLAQTVNPPIIPPGGTTFVSPQAPNTFFGGPTSGGSALPGFRGFVAADVPASIIILTSPATGGAPVNLPTFINAQPVIPQQYGAKCDGSTDDSVALQAWLNVLGTVTVSASPTYAGFIPGGTCTFQSALTGPVFKNAVAIFGAGSGSQLRYTGASTTLTPISWGTSTGGCSGQSYTFKDFIISSATLMTAGSAMEFDDICSLRMENIQVLNNSGGASGNWSTGITIKGGNQIYLLNNQITGNANALLLAGDNGAHSGTQQTDPRVIGGTLAGGANSVGLHVAGNVGGLTVDAVDIINNQTQIRIDQSLVALPNLQLTLGATLFLDITAGINGRSIDIQDPGGIGSILLIYSTWLSSAGESCLSIAANANWELTWTGGGLINCGLDGFTNNSVNLRGSINNVFVDMKANGFTGGTGYAFSCTVVNYNFKIINPYIVNGNAAGQVSPNCNSTNAVVVVPNGTPVALPNGRPTQIAVRNTVTLDTAEYICGNGSCVLVATPGTVWVASTTTPAAGKSSVQGNAGTYNVYNNTGGAITVSAAFSNN